jgi:hypothetical protein
MSLSDCVKCWDTPCRCPDGEIGQLKARIAQLEAAARWIPCSERLPDGPCEDVYFTDGWNGYYGEYRWYRTLRMGLSE